jgi:hypothetical protein
MASIFFLVFQNCAFKFLNNMYGIYVNIKSITRVGLEMERLLAFLLYKLGFQINLVFEYYSILIE